MNIIYQLIQYHLFNKIVKTIPLQNLSTNFKFDKVLFDYNQNYVKVLLNREKNLNALDSEMAEIISKETEKWNDPKNNINLVILQGKGRAFCAGGDIKSIYEVKQNQNKDYLEIIDQMLMKEYQFYNDMNQLIPKSMSIMDGFVFGGGVGTGIYCKYRIATENTVYSMPEAKIGYFCDVGASYFVPRIRNNLGLYQVLTCIPFNGYEMASLGLANYYIKSQDINTILQQINEQIIMNKTNLMEQQIQIEKILQNYQQQVTSKLDYEDKINKLFNQTTFHGLIKNLQDDNSQLSQQILSKMKENCPLSLRLIFEMMIKPAPSVTESLIQDFRVGHWMMREHDFYEGVRCMIIDKGAKPQWKYKDPLDIDQKLIDKILLTEVDLEAGFRKLLEKRRNKQ